MPIVTTPIEKTDVESVTAPTIATCDAFIAESSTAGTFGRRNYMGVNWGRRVVVPGFPYALQVSFVVVMRVPAGIAIDELNFKLSTSWGDEFNHHLGSFTAQNGERTFAIEWVKLELILKSEGDFRLDVTYTGFRQSITWTAGLGPGPLRRGPTTLAGSALIDGRSGASPLAQLASEVRGSLVIADQYATPEFMRSLLPSGEQRWICQLIVSKRCLRQRRDAWLEILQEHPSMEVRADDLIHDRFVVRDDEEAYAFGHSLKDLDSGRVSFFTRIYDVEQFQLIRQVIAESWERAERLPLGGGAG